MVRPDLVRECILRGVKPAGNVDQLQELVRAARLADEVRYQRGFEAEDDKRLARRSSGPGCGLTPEEWAKLNAARGLGSLPPLPSSASSSNDDLKSAQGAPVVAPLVPSGPPPDYEGIMGAGHQAPDPFAPPQEEDDEQGDDCDKSEPLSEDSEPAEEEDDCKMPDTPMELCGGCEQRFKGLPLYLVDNGERWDFCSHSCIVQLLEKSNRV